MDRITIVGFPTENEQLSTPNASSPGYSAETPKRYGALVVLIQKTRALQSLPGFSDAELNLHVATWRDALSDIPDSALVAAWDRATKQHDWDRPFAVPSILRAYREVVAEDRERIEATKKYERWKRAETYRCHWCADTGYTPLAIPCPTRRDIWRGRRACSCDMTPIAQRLPPITTRDWVKDEKGYWAAPAGQEPRCNCQFCRNRPQEVN